MNKKTEKQLFDCFVNELSDDSKDLLDIEPSFIYKGQTLRLDFIGKADKIFLEKVFKEIEKDGNDKINFELIKKEAEDVYSAAKEMHRLQSKEYLTTADVKKIYNWSTSTVSDYRGRLNDPLPHKKNVAGGKIIYVAEDVKKWFNNEYS